MTDRVHDLGEVFAEVRPAMHDEPCEGVGRRLSQDGTLPNA